MAVIKGTHFEKYGDHPAREERGVVILTTDNFSPELLAELYQGAFVEVDESNADRRVIGPTRAHYAKRSFSWRHLAFSYHFISVAWNAAESNYILQTGACVRRSFALTVRFYENYADARKAALEFLIGKS